MSVCKPSNFAENSPRLQHSNKQEQILLEKRKAFMTKQEKQALSSVSIDQKLIVRRIKTNLERSVTADERIASVRGVKGNTQERTSSELKKAWAGNDMLNKETPALTSHDVLPTSLAVPAAINILHLHGHKVHPSVAQKAAVPNMDAKSRPKPNTRVGHKRAGNKHRRSSIVSTNSSGSVVDKKRPRDLQIPELHVRPSSAPKVQTNSKQLATAMWLASQTDQSPSSKRPVSAIVVRTSGEAPESASRAESSMSGVVTFSTPPNSPPVPRVYEDSSTTRSIDELVSKLGESDPRITLVDLHRATVASKNYPTRIKALMRRISKYKSDSTRYDDYYASRLTARVVPGK